MAIFYCNPNFCHDIIFTNHSTWRFIFIVHECKRFLTLERRTGFMDTPTIYDVSRLSGVSTATVSRTFTTPDRVRESTRRRVYAAAEALHYQPSAIARAMARQQTDKIAFLICKEGRDHPGMNFSRQHLRGRHAPRQRHQLPASDLHSGGMDPHGPRASRSRVSSWQAMPRPT